MQRKSRNNAPKQLLILVISLGGLGLMIILGLFSELKCIIFGYTDFTSLQVDEIETGMYVRAELVQNYGCFANKVVSDNVAVLYKEGIGETTDWYYVIYTGASDDYVSEYKYMAIGVSEDDYPAMETMTENTYNGEIYDTLVLYGRICPMTSSMEEYFVEFFEDFGYTDDEIEEMILPYYIDASDGKLSWSSASAILFILAAIFLISAVVGFIRILTVFRQNKKSY
ncbi:MAG: hypothetical protein LUE20_06315 [Oscillospiraceae bacterium]|nr:hypothetical protein [Oscillospiraceae bacterium]